MKIFLLFAFLCLTSLGASAEVGASEVKFVTDNQDVKVGERYKIEVQVKDMVDVYAGDIEISFPQGSVKIIDENDKKTGVQIKQGEFLNEEKQFLIKSGANQRDGIIKFASTLLNPAPPAKGDGVILEFGFIPTQKGDIQFLLKKADFATMDKTLLSLGGEKISFSATRQPYVEQAEVMSSLDPIYIVVLLLCAIILVMFVFLVKLKGKKSMAS